MNFLKELNKIDMKDLKSVDVGQIKAVLFGRLEIVISLALIAATIAGIVVLSGNRKQETGQLNYRITQLKEKVTIVQEQKNIQKSYDDFFSTFPKAIETDQLIDNLSSLAASHHIQIQSFSPAEEISGEYWSTTSMSINVSSSNYKDIIQFVKDIENLPYAVQIQKWSGKPKYENRYIPKDKQNGVVIEANIKIGAITLKK